MTLLIPQAPLPVRGVPGASHAARPLTKNGGQESSGGGRHGGGGRTDPSLGSSVRTGPPVVTDWMAARAMVRAAREPSPVMAGERSVRRR
ncbi:hypothetical protein GCM10010211_71540 [Streptomyces albospinus]|uniref:Uncharacterized protein n=1 Tax=Streptomyces albospinus TaxID=285515 RepID=A0ABQ2VLI3_9ACTN|nr:hypothetical protein GCM10010211_71540 [Streptomyces albospinus]